MKLVLWDIDGTLVHTAGHGRDAFGQAFAAVFGRDADVAEVRMSGRTDDWIARAVLEGNGVDDGDSHMPQMFIELERALAARRAAIVAEGSPMPGARAALEALEAQPDVTQSVLTGNIKANALLKLAAFGLEDLVDLDIGGYGSDHGVRSELVEVAREKAARLRGLQIDVENVVLIGDTPLDVDAARTAGARAVAVASGDYDTDLLARSGADLVLADLTDPEAVIDAVTVTEPI